MEHYKNIRVSWVAFGWFIAAAVTAFVVFVLIAAGVLGAAAPAGGDVWVSAALMVGFLSGGFITGLRTGAAPILHGVAIGVFSLVVWLGANLIFGEAMRLTTWTALGFGTTAGLLVLQTAAAIVGTRMGVRWRRS